MFEQYSEPGRRAVLFALQEAQALGSPRIDTVHLLLGILREDANVARQVGTGAFQTIRKELEQVAPPRQERVAPPGDLPLSRKARLAMTYATKEAAELDSQQIEPPHLILGLLRVKECTAAKLLRAYGMESRRYRETLRGDALQ
ncbi:MAG TPA: Clp protease N-terminal domain-containing protein [Bryobacteraceae bacterium]|nr:Clp protease N-terminal domain-containing protein [Bryobacteraceae bacterium]